MPNVALAGTCWHPCHLSIGKHGLRGISSQGGNLEVLHPGSHWADPDQQVLGPSRQVLGASGSWGVEAGEVL